MANVKNVSEYLSAFPLGLARSNRYMVSFLMPPGIPSSGGYMNTESQAGTIEANGRRLNTNGAIDISCHTASLPARTLMTYQLAQHSAPFSVPYSQLYDPISFSFYSSAHHNQRQFFDIWQTAVVNINDNSLNFFDEYTQDIDIWQLDRQGNKTYGVKIYAAWPLAIVEVPFGYGTNNTVVEVTVSMQFKLWKANHDTTEIVIY